MVCLEQEAIEVWGGGGGRTAGAVRAQHWERVLEK